MGTTETQINVQKAGLFSILNSLDKGSFVSEVETELAHAMQKVGQRGVKAKGKVVITLDIECLNRDPESLFSDGQIVITPDVKATLPRKSRASKSMFVTSEQDPVVTFQNPDQQGVI